MKNLLTLALLLTVLGCQTHMPADIAIQNINVIDVQNGEVIENQTVVIRNQRISEIHGADSEVDTARLIDGTGKYLIPGLWDMHVHFRGGEELIEENRNLLPLYIANGITTVRDGGGDITPSVLEWINQIDRGELTGPTIFTSGPKLDGPNPRWGGSIEIESAEQIPAAIDSLESLGVDYVKIYDSTLSGDLFMAIVEEADRRGLPVTGHMPFELIFEETVKQGLSATEHIFYAFKGSSSEEEEITREMMERQGTDNPMGFREMLVRLMESQDEEHSADLYQAMVEYETGIIPTLHIMDVLANLKNRDHSSDEYLDYIGPGIQETYQGRLRAALNAPDDQLNIYDLPGYGNVVTAMANQGVRIYAGSDAGPYNTFVYPGISLHRELQLLVDAGLTPAQALQAATYHPPHFFDLQDSYGRVSEGYAADLLLLDANPLENISHTERIHMVIVNGHKVYEKSGLVRMLEELRELYE